VAVKPLAEEVLLVYARAHLTVPHGRLAGKHRAVQTLVLTRRDGTWQVAAFQNTLVALPTGPPPTS
jgi:uncharacterized protein (TIGR02246 family)